MKKASFQLKYQCADPGCLSRILILIYPVSNNRPKRRGEYHKIVNNYFFEPVKKICLVKTLRIILLFTQKFIIKL
jgi:hypothetical protein